VYSCVCIYVSIFAYFSDVRHLYSTLLHIKYLYVLSNANCTVYIFIVTDSEKEECVDPGENGAILDAGGVEGPGPPGWGKNGQLTSDSGGG
jgi:hypothetical protein